MKLPNFFQIQLKKPTLSANEKKAEEWKNNARRELSGIRSRLESVEILNGNGKFDDSVLLATDILRNVVRVSASFFGIQESGVMETLQKLPVDRDWKKESQWIQKLESQSIEEDLALEIEKGLTDLVDAIHSAIRKTLKTEYHTPLDDFKVRWKVQAFVLGLILTASLSYFINYKIEHKEVGEDQVMLFWENSEHSFEGGYRLQVPLHLDSQWHDYSFELDRPAQVSKIRFDPVTQTRVRFQIEKMILMDAKGREISEYDFHLSENLMPRSVSIVESFIGMESGQTAPGRPMEGVSSQNETFFVFNLQKTFSGVKSVVIKMRVLPKYKKFQD